MMLDNLWKEWAEILLVEVEGSKERERKLHKMYKFAVKVLKTLWNDMAEDVKGQREILELFIKNNRWNEIVSSFAAESDGISSMMELLCLGSSVSIFK